MSEKFNINNYNNVKVEKLGGNNPSTTNNNSSTDDNLKNVQFTPIPVEEVSDSEYNSDKFTSGSETSDIDTDIEHDTDDDNNSSTDTDLSVDVPINNNDIQELSGGKTKSSDTESVSSVSTTEILSKDPLFLVLSEFLMDDETGSNIVHVGNDIVKVLSKINSKLGRIADSLEKKQKKEALKKRSKE